MEFTDSIPEEVAKKLEDKNTQPDFENGEDDYSKSVLTAIWSDNDNVQVICMAVWKEDRIQELDTPVSYTHL